MPKTANYHMVYNFTLQNSSDKLVKTVHYHTSHGRSLTDGCEMDLSPSFSAQAVAHARRNKNHKVYFTGK